MVREDLELSAIQRVLLDHLDTTISNLRDLLSDPLSRIFATFALLTNHVNKPNIFEPTTYQQIISNQLFRIHWELAMQDEYKSLINNNTWYLIQTPSDAHILRDRWVYIVKRDFAEEVTRYKTRWVIRGFEQQKSRDYHDTFASVVKLMSYKAIFALTAVLNWDVKQINVKIVFLYDNVQETIYVRQLDDFSKNDIKVCKLNKTLYELKQSLRI